jgi:MFS family permease
LIRYDILNNIFRSLKYKNYRYFFAGQSISLVGTWIQRIAMPWLVYHLTGSAFLLGLVGFAGQIPTFLLAPFAGVITDRYNKYFILMSTQILAMLQALALAILYFLQIINIWHIVLLNVLLGCVNAFDIPSRQSFVIELVEKKEDLGNAIALNSSMVNGARLLGPSIAGIIIATVGEGVCFFINAVSYLFVIFSLMKIKVHNKRTNNHKRKHLLKELREGLSYTFGFAPIRSVILLLALVSLMGIPYAILMPVFVKQVLHGGSHVFGFLMGASGFGALIGAIYLAARKNVIGLEHVIPFSAIAFGGGLIIFSMCRVYLMSILLMVIIGLSMMLQMAGSNTILQTIVDDDKRGRVMSFYTMAFMGTAPFGSLMAGGFADILGVSHTLTLCGFVCVISACIFLKNYKSNLIYSKKMKNQRNQ